eukprot:9542278-Heterocapsa_arctica.AAC.1
MATSPSPEARQFASLAGSLSQASLYQVCITGIICLLEPDQNPNTLLHVSHTLIYNSSQTHLVKYGS